MTKEISTFPRLTRSVIRSRNGLLSLLPAPLAHSVSGAGGFWDEIIPLLLMGLTLVGLGVFAFLSRRNRDERRDE